jgi:hypothetical protein
VLDSSAGCQHGCRNHADGTGDLSPDDDPILNPPATCGVHVLVRSRPAVGIMPSIWAAPAKCSPCWSRGRFKEHL